VTRFEVLWRIPFLCSHISNATIQSFLIKAATHRLPVHCDPIGFKYSYCMPSHSRHNHPSNMYCHPISSSWSIAFFIFQLYVAVSCLLLHQLLRLLTITCVISGSVFACSSHLCSYCNKWSQTCIEASPVQLRTCSIVSNWLHTLANPSHTHSVFHDEMLVGPSFQMHGGAHSIPCHIFQENQVDLFLFFPREDSLLSMNKIVNVLWQIH